MAAAIFRWLNIYNLIFNSLSLPRYVTAEAVLTTHTKWAYGIFTGKAQKDYMFWVRKPMQIGEAGRKKISI